MNPVILIMISGAVCVSAMSFDNKIPELGTNPSSFLFFQDHLSPPMEGHARYPTRSPTRHPTRSPTKHPTRSPTQHAHKHHHHAAYDHLKAESSLKNVNSSHNRTYRETESSPEDATATENAATSENATTAESVTTAANLFSTENAATGSAVTTSAVTAPSESAVTTANVLSPENVATENAATENVVTENAATENAPTENAPTENAVHKPLLQHQHFETILSAEVPVAANASNVTNATTNTSSGINIRMEVDLDWSSNMSQAAIDNITQGIKEELAEVYGVPVGQIVATINGRTLTAIVNNLTPNEIAMATNNDNKKILDAIQRITGVDAEWEAEPFIEFEGCTSGMGTYSGWYYKFVNENVPWHTANLACQKLKGSLAGIKSTDEGLYVSDYIKKCMKPTFEVWTGANDINEEGVWVWPDSGEVPPYNLWAPQEPNDAGGAEDCASLFWSSYLREEKLQDRQCWMELPYVCKSRSIFVEPSESTPGETVEIGMTVSYPAPLTKIQKEDQEQKIKLKLSAFYTLPLVNIEVQMILEKEWMTLLQTYNYHVKVLIHALNDFEVNEVVNKAESQVETMVQTATNALVKITEAPHKLVGDLAEGLGNVAEKTKEALEKPLLALSNATKEAVDKVKEALETPLEALSDAAKKAGLDNVANKAKEVLANPLDTLTNAAKQAGSGLGNLVKSVFGW